MRPMMLRPAVRRLLSVFFVRLGGCAAIGVLFGGMVGAAVLEPSLLGVAFGALAGAIYAAALMVFIGGAEMFLPRTRLGKELDRAPFLLTFVVKLLAYSMVILVFAGGRVGTRVAATITGIAIGGDLALELEQQLKTSFPFGQLVAVTIVVVLAVLLLFQLSQQVGERTFRAIALGRYHRPRVEERFFLFVDIVGSTPLAERLGPAAVHEFLDRVFQLASDPIDDHAGEVYQYVGDEIVITWTVPEGRADARPLACLFAMQAALGHSAPEFERDFGTVPKLRAALHAGEVVTGEIGGSRRAIVFHGDVMNTTSRIENLTRELSHPFLVSEDALRHLEGAEGYSIEDLGPQQLRGRQVALRVLAVAPRSEPHSPATPK